VGRPVGCGRVNRQAAPNPCALAKSPTGELPTMRQNQAKHGEPCALTSDGLLACLQTQERPRRGLPRCLHARAMRRPRAGQACGLRDQQRPGAVQRVL
jgi:hypothetical protein